MALTATQSGAVEVIELAGRLDAYSASPIVTWLSERITRPAGPVQIVANLASVSFIDSTALATLVKGMKQCRKSGGDLRLCELQQPVRIVFELTRLDSAFAIFGDTGEAVGSFAPA